MQEPPSVLGVEANCPTSPHPLPSSISPPEAGSHLVERMPQPWMAAFDLQHVAQLPARLLRQGATAVLFQPAFLPLSYVAWQPASRRKAGTEVGEKAGQKRQK